MNIRFTKSYYWIRGYFTFTVRMWLVNRSPNHLKGFCASVPLNWDFLGPRN